MVVADHVFRLRVTLPPRLISLFDAVSWYAHRDHQELVQADVVLTTYAIVENEHRKAYAGDKVACPDCGRT